MTDNAKWQAALKGLRAIAYDPRETPARRRKAERALEEMRKGSLGGMSTTSVGNAEGAQRTTRGMNSIAVRDYQGFCGWTARY